ncbi:MAG: sugar phosphate isomerase/epimerase family protein [Planctomycetota bacterium]|nr:sugar phosphate isomerase/epimerase family protein [Planctomycetota bacterium]
MKIALSSVVCPEWTLARLAQEAEALAIDAVELRTFGDDSTTIACDPFLTDPAKTRRLMQAAGLSIACIATGIHYDERITPPIVGRLLFDTERSVRQSKRAVDLAAELECPFVRVFGFEIPANEPRADAMERIVDRLQKSLDHCRHTGVRLILENGGSFASAQHLLDLIRAVDHPLLAAAYSIPTGVLAGDDPVRALDLLGPLCVAIKLKDVRETSGPDRTPCILGEGLIPVAPATRAFAARRQPQSFATYELDRLWLARGPAHAAQEHAAHAHAAPVVSATLAPAPEEDLLHAEGDVPTPPSIHTDWRTILSTSIANIAAWRAAETPAPGTSRFAKANASDHAAGPGVPGKQPIPSRSFDGVQSTVLA